MLKEEATKFISEVSFDHEKEDLGPSKLELEYARGFEEGKVEGHSEGYEEAMGSIDIQTLNVLQTVKDELEQVFLHFDSLVESNTKYSIDLIHKISEKLFLNLSSSTLVERVIKILQETLSLVVDQRHLILYVAPDLVESIKKRLSENQDFNELARRLEIVGSDLFKGSECKLAWAKGSLEVNPKETWDKINAIIDSHRNDGDQISDPSQLPEARSQTTEETEQPDAVLETEITDEVLLDNTETAEKASDEELTNDHEAPTEETPVVLEQLFESTEAPEDVFEGTEVTEMAKEITRKDLTGNKKKTNQTQPQKNKEV